MTNVAQTTGVRTTHSRNRGKPSWLIMSHHAATWLLVRLILSRFQCARRDVDLVRKSNRRFKICSRVAPEWRHDEYITAALLALERFTGRSAREGEGTMDVCRRVARVARRPHEPPPSPADQSVPSRPVPVWLGTGTTCTHIELDRGRPNRSTIPLRQEARRHRPITQQQLGGCEHLTSGGRTRTGQRVGRDASTGALS